MIGRRRPPERIFAPQACAATLLATRREMLAVRLLGRRVRCVDDVTGDLLLCRRWRGRLYFDRILERDYDWK